LSSCSRPWRDLSDNLKAIQHDQDVTGLDALAASRTMLEEQPYAFHGRLLQRNLAASPRPYGAMMWSLVQLIAMLEKETQKKTPLDAARDRAAGRTHNPVKPVTVGRDARTNTDRHQEEDP
jgi:hypothetical protein